MNKLDATYNECSLRDLRWALLAQKGKEGQQLPPTLGTLIPNVHRAFYMAPISITNFHHLPTITGNY